MARLPRPLVLLRAARRYRAAVFPVSAQELRAKVTAKRAEAERLGRVSSDLYREANELEREADKRAHEEHAKIPVDRSQRVLTDGSPVTADHAELKPDGQQKAYVVLSEEERAKGYVRPVRRSYVHVSCGATTTMSQAIAETYARDPRFYSGTFCVQCNTHLPVGEQGEFVWDDGTRVGT